MTIQSISSLHRHNLRGSPFGGGGGKLAYAMNWEGQDKAEGHQPNRTRKKITSYRKATRVLHKSFEKSMFQTALKRLISQQNNNSQTEKKNTNI